MDGLELGASNFSCVFAFGRKNSPVDYFAGGSREASPASGTKNRQETLVACRFYLFIIHSSLFTKNRQSIFGSEEVIVKRE